MTKREEKARTGSDTSGPVDTKGRTQASEKNRSKAAAAPRARSTSAVLPKGFANVFCETESISRPAASALSDIAGTLGAAPWRVWQASSPYRTQETFPAAMLEAQAEGARLLNGEAGVGKVRLLVDDEFRQYVSHAIEYARKSVWICAAMLTAHHRGVRALFRPLRLAGEGRPDVRILVADSSGIWPLIGNGSLRHSEVRVLRSNGRAHARLALFDERKFIAGSHGFTPTSLFSSREASLAVEGDERIVADATTRFDTMWAAAQKL